eukprot:gene3610-13044_t
MPPERKGVSPEEKNSLFSWSDEEIQLLLEVILHYKADKAGQGFDWECIKTKYTEIGEIFLERYPKDAKSEGLCCESPAAESVVGGIDTSSFDSSSPINDQPSGNNTTGNDGDIKCSQSSNGFDLDKNPCLRGPAFNQLQQVQYTPAQGGSQGVLDQIKSANQRPYQEVRRTHIADFEESDDEITYVNL